MISTNNYVLVLSTTNKEYKPVNFVYVVSFSKYDYT